MACRRVSHSIVPSHWTPVEISHDKIVESRTAMHEWFDGADSACGLHTYQAYPEKSQIRGGGLVALFTFEHASTAMEFKLRFG